jgi:hypothetical protein
MPSKSRRKVKQDAVTNSVKLDPIAMLEEFRVRGQLLNPVQARAYLAEVRRERKHWRGE